MKLFSVHLEVRISEIGELEPAPTEEQQPLESLVGDRQKDSPLKDAARLLDGYIDRVMAPPRRGPFFPGGGDGGSGVTMVETVQVAAASFEDLQKILIMFHDTAKRLTIDGQS